MYGARSRTIASVVGGLALAGLSCTVTLGAPLRLAMTVLAEAPASEGPGPTIDPGAGEGESTLASGDLAPLLTEAAGAGVDLVLTQVGGAWSGDPIYEASAMNGPVEQASEALAAAASAGVDLVLGPVSLTSDPARAAADHQALAALVHEMERVAADSPAYSGVAVALPLPPALPEGASPQQIEDGLSAWCRGVVEGLAPPAQELAKAGRRLYIAGDSAAVLSLVVEAMTCPVVPIARVTLGREPTMGYPMALGLAGALPMGFGVMLASSAPTEAQVSRALCQASLRGAEVVCLGDARVLLGRAFRSARLLPTARGLCRFVDGLGRHNLNRGIALLLDRKGMADELLCPRIEGPSEMPAASSAAMLLNAGGFAWHVVIRAQDLAGDGAQVVIIPSGAHLGSDVLDAIEAYVRAGGQVVCFADFAAYRPAGGERLVAERQNSDLLLPVERRRRTNVGVTALRLVAGIPGAVHPAQVDIPVPSAEQSVFRVEVREGAQVLAEYTNLRLQAAVAWPIGAGRLVWINGHPAMFGDNVLADVMAYLGVVPMTSGRGGDLRGPTYQAEQDMRTHERERLAEYRGIMLNPETFPPSGFMPDGGVYDLYFSGPDLAAVSLGYRHEVLPSGSMVALSQADAGLHAYRTAMATTDGQAVFTDGSGYVEWPTGGAAQRFVPGQSSFETWIYEPQGSRLRAVGPGYFRVEQGIEHHALTDDGGAPVLRAVQDPEGRVELSVGQDAAIAVRLLPNVLAQEEVTVARTTAGLGLPTETPGELPVGEEHWFVDHTGVLHLAAQGGVLYKVGFGPRPAEPPLMPLDLAQFAGARYGTVDGQAAVWLERYSYETAVVRFVHWGEAPKGASLVLHGVTGDLYGAVLADVPNPPARLRVFLNDREVSDAAALTPACVLDGDGAEWADVTIPIPKEALHRGLNVLRITNEGPNWFAFSSASVDFGAA